MSIKENLLQSIHESEDYPICNNITEIENKVYTEPCYHIYCIWCLGKWCNDNTTCPMDRLNMEKVHVYNPIEDDIKVVEITNFICENILRERHNVLKVFTEELIRISSGCMETYNYGILLSNSLKKIYEIFTEESFQILLDIYPNDSKREIDVFVQLLDSTESELI